MASSIFWELDKEPTPVEEVERVEITREESGLAANLYGKMEDFIGTVFAEDGCVTETSVTTFPDEQLIEIRLSDNLFDGEEAFSLTATTDFTGRVKTILLNRRLDQTLINYINRITPEVFYRRKSSTQEIPDTVDIQKAQRLSIPLDIVIERVHNYLETRKTPGIPLSIPTSISWLLNGGNFKLQVGEEPVLNHEVKNSPMISGSTTRDIERLKVALMAYPQYMNIGRISPRCFFSAPQESDEYPGETVNTYMSVTLDPEEDIVMTLNMGSIIYHHGSSRFWRMEQRFVLGNLNIESGGKTLWRLSRNELEQEGLIGSKFEVLPTRHQSTGTGRELSTGEPQPHVNIADLLLSIINRKLVNNR